MSIACWLCIAGESAVRGLALTNAQGDFSAHSKQFLLKQQEEAAPAVSDVPVSEVLEPPPAPGVKAAVKAAFLSLIRTEKSKEPLTYLNALSAGAIVTDLTESESQEKVVLSPSKRLAAFVEITRLKMTLWWLDALFGMAMWMGSFVPHDESHHAHKDPG
jgi:hypothetical protein